MSTWALNHGVRLGAAQASAGGMVTMGPARDLLSVDALYIEQRDPGSPPVVFLGISDAGLTKRYCA